jgi:hypothetical protein
MFVFERHSKTKCPLSLLCEMHFKGLNQRVGNIWN